MEYGKVTILLFTHDAVGDGEDGPTHQPVEHLASLRAMPGLVLLRNRHEERRGLFQHIRLGRRRTTREAVFTRDHLRDARAVLPVSGRN